MATVLGKTLKFLGIALLINAFSITANAQEYSQALKENPERAAGVYHYYEYTPTAMTRAPKGYKPFYISHYGRHGSRYHSGLALFGYAKECLDSADKAGILTEEGELLKRQIDTLKEEHLGMFGMLTERGAKEHREIGERMSRNYPQVFSGKSGRDSVECVASYYPRCLMSMANSVAGIQENAGEVKFHYLTGPKYLDYISMNLSTRELNKEAGRLSEELRDSLVPYHRFFKAMFTDQEKALEIIKEPQSFMEKVFVAGAGSPNTIAKPAIFKHFTLNELEAESYARDNRIYYCFGISKEGGDYSQAIAKPLIEDIVSKADAAIKDGSSKAADLRYGHDVGLLPLVGCLGITGWEQRWSYNEITRYWHAWNRIPMGSNIQIIFYKNKSGDVIAKLVYNEKEVTIPALKTWNGPYYKWSDLREYMLEKISAIPDSMIIKDSGLSERI